MASLTKSVLHDKACAFAIRVVRAHQYLLNERHEFILSKQFIRCGTAIGANIAEANGGISTADFSAKLSIAYNECLEVNYWLSLMKDTGYMDDKAFLSMYQDADELAKMLYAVLKKTRISKDG